MSGDVARVRCRINALIARGLGVAMVRHGLGLEGVSEAWGGPEDDDHPTWYVWLDCAAGAYRLRLEDRGEAEPADGQRDDTVRRALFSISYYPAPQEPVFRHFSAEERALITSDHVDATGTPGFDSRALIDPRLFKVAVLEVIDDTAAAQTSIVFSGLDRMVSRNDGTQAARTLPAWDLGYPLFDSLTGLYAFAARLPPKRVILSRQPGVEFVGLDGACRDSNRTALKTLLVVFPADVGQPATGRAESSLVATLRRPPWSVVLDTGQPPAGHRHASSAHGPSSCAQTREPVTTAPSAHAGPCTCVRPATPPFAFNEQWWRLATLTPSADTLPCGCN